jgi:hypothetical protein
MQMDASYQTIVAVSAKAFFEKRILMIETVSFTAIVAVQRWTEVMQMPEIVKVRPKAEKRMQPFDSLQ